MPNNYHDIIKTLQINTNIPINEFSRRVLYCAEIEIVVITLPKDYDFPLHYHQDCAVYTKMLLGKVEETIIKPNESPTKVILQAPQEYYLPPFSFHKLRVLENSLMLNVYDPPISNKEQNLTPEQEKYLKDLL
jgi:hypothetical protein